MDCIICCLVSNVPVEVKIAFAEDNALTLSIDSSDPEEIIKSVNKGIYAVNFSGGQVDITSGKFVFSASDQGKY